MRPVMLIGMKQKLSNKVTSEYCFRDAFQDTPFGIYFFHILYSRQLKRLKDVQRPLFFQDNVMGGQGCIKMKTCLAIFAF